MPVEVLIEDARWEGPGLPALADRAVTATLRHLGLDPAAFTVSLMGGDDARIAALNADFRGKPTPTNVLSWPADDLAPDRPGDAPAVPEPGPHDDPAELGDIALAFETCTGEAAASGLAVEHHVLHLIVHGTLHLLGYDHAHDADATRMEELEVAILATLGVADPY